MMILVNLACSWLLHTYRQDGGENNWMGSRLKVLCPPVLIVKIHVSLCTSYPHPVTNALLWCSEVTTKHSWITEHPSGSHDSLSNNIMKMIIMMESMLILYHPLHSVDELLQHHVNSLCPHWPPLELTRTPLPSRGNTVTWEWDILCCFWPFWQLHCSLAQPFALLYVHEQWSMQREHVQLFYTTLWYP